MQTQRVMDADQSILRNPDTLKNGYVADPVQRRDERRRIRDHLEPVWTRGDYRHVHVTGPPGTGKSTCINAVLDGLDADTNVTTITVNCVQMATPTAALNDCVRQLQSRLPHSRDVSRRRPLEMQADELRQAIDRVGKVVIAFDAVQRVQQLTTLLAVLREVADAADAPVAFVFESPRPWSELADGEAGIDPVEVVFDRYDRDTVREIVERRAWEAFGPSAVSDDVLEAVVAWAVEEQSADAPVPRALAVLRRAGDAAEREDADRVTLEHVAGAVNPTLVSGGDRPDGAFEL